MRKAILVLICAGFGAVFSLGAAARGPGGGGGFGGEGFSRGSPTGPSASEALQNSNGRFSADRDTGLERAEDRMSPQGRERQKATTEARKKRSKTRDRK